MIHSTRVPAATVRLAVYQEVVLGKFGSTSLMITGLLLVLISKVEEIRSETSASPTKLATKTEDLSANSSTDEGSDENYGGRAPGSMGNKFDRWVAAKIEREKSRY